MIACSLGYLLRTIFTPVLSKVVCRLKCGLDWFRRVGPDLMGPSNPRSLALGALYQAIMLRSNTVDDSTEEKEKAEKAIYDACQKCYEASISRTELHSIIRAVVAEFRQPVA